MGAGGGAGGGAAGGSTAPTGATTGPGKVAIVACRGVGLGPAAGTVAGVQGGACTY